MHFHVCLCAYVIHPKVGFSLKIYKRTRVDTIEYEAACQEKGSRGFLSCSIDLVAVFYINVNIYVF